MRFCGFTALRQVLDVDRAQAARQHAATCALAALDLPVAAPLAMADGQTILDLDGALYAVYPWVLGEHVRGTAMTPAQAVSLGSTLARIHEGLASVMDLADQAMRMPVTDPATAIASTERYAEIIAGKGDRDDFDEYAARQLARRRALLETAGQHIPGPDAWWEPAGWAHGDFHDLNVLWHDGAITAVVDFDRLGPKPYAYELVRSATLTFCHGDDRGLDTGLAAAFTAGYRAVITLADDQIEFAVTRMWWERACDFWQLKRHYLNSDNSCDHLFRSASALLWWWTGHRDQVTRCLTSR